LSYAEKFIKSKGLDCIINRPTPLNVKVSIKKSTNSSRDFGVREALWEGLIPIDSNLISGEVLTIKSDKYIALTVEYDLASDEYMFYCAKCNLTVEHKRYEETADDDLNIIQTWLSKKSNISAYGEVITYRLIQQDPGLLEGTKYTLQVPKSLEVELLDRFVYNNEKYQVVSLDDVGLIGVVRCQLSADTRPD